MTLDHFGHVSELSGHSECLFSDPNLGLSKLQDGVAGKLKLQKPEMKLHGRLIYKAGFFGKLHRIFTSHILLESAFYCCLLLQ